jgi:hypothetical protein
MTKYGDISAIKDPTDSQFEFKIKSIANEPKRNTTAPIARLIIANLFSI